MEPSEQGKNEFYAWVHQELGAQVRLIDPMQGDASVRRYYRVYTERDSLVAMDASDIKASCQPFVAIANALREMGLHTPAIMAEDTMRGYLLLSDLGHQTYLSILNSDNADHLYEMALNALCVLQQCHVRDVAIPPFTVEFMLQEWAWHKEWFLQKWLGLELGTLEKVLDKTYEPIAQSAASQPQVFMHRDYHSGNLMLLPSDDVGILDFQDAFIGPITYDLASLLRDCYISWPEECVLEWVLLYWQMLQSTDELQGVSQQTFLMWFDWMGVQRHLKALMTFSRKSVRDHTDHYLQFIPRTLNYILQVTEHYPELSVLHDYYLHVVLPAVNKKEIACAQ